MDFYSSGKPLFLDSSSAAAVDTAIHEVSSWTLILCMFSLLYILSFLNGIPIKNGLLIVINEKKFKLLGFIILFWFFLVPNYLLNRSRFLGHEHICISVFGFQKTDVHGAKMLRFTPEKVYFMQLLGRHLNLRYECYMFLPLKLLVSAVCTSFFWGAKIRCSIADLLIEI